MGLEWYFSERHTKKCYERSQLLKRVPLTIFNLLNGLILLKLGLLKDDKYNEEKMIQNITT